MNTPQIIIEWSSCLVCRDSYPFCDLLEGQRGAYCCEACMECAGDLPKPTVQALLTRSDWAEFFIHCTGCTKEIPLLEIPLYDERQPVYCSQACRAWCESPERLARENAPLRKPQPTGLRIDGWDL